MARRLLAFAFVSGLVSLTYQVMWMRSLRLVFGASTAANAVVVSIFMAGLGIGGLYFGRRADTWDRPMARYAFIEGAIGVSAMLTVALVHPVEWIYYALGGASSLGHVGATLVRLALAVVLLGPPTFLMGGTLPALARLIERDTDADTSRRAVGLLYGANTLGAVTGAIWATFFSLEVFGVSRSLLVAGVVNLLLAVVVHAEHRREPPSPATPETGDIEKDEPDGSSPTEPDLRAHGLTRWFILGAAAIVGFVFFAMEMVWYRILAPLLGGSSYSFGLILITALLGIGLGGALYGAGARTRRPTLVGLGQTCAVEAVCIGAPLAFGDGVALLAVQTRGLAAFGFWGLVSSWALLTGLTVLPAAVIAGFQFPYLLALIGAGRREVAQDVGVTYLFNTAGSVVGAAASGLSLLVVVGAIPLWRTLVWILVGLSVVSIVLGVRQSDARRDRVALATAISALALAIVGGLGPGPSAAARHTPIGAGRVEVFGENFATIQNWRHQANRITWWEADGIESTVAITASDGVSLIHNGKSDGNAFGDASTQIGLGLVGAALHPAPKRALVIGLGTGETAGWLGGVPGMEAVDVVELEPEVLHVAEVCTPINGDVLNNERVTVHLGDAREFLTVSGEHYDLVVSEPSNPYRAGVASLFSRDYYQRAHARLGDDGIFVQWVQGYEIDSRTLRVVLTTLREVFPAVEIWTLGPSDYALVAYRRGPPVHDLARIGTVLGHEHYRAALSRTMLVDGVPGLFANFVANPRLVDTIHAVDQDWVDTDDAPVLEFGFMRSVGQKRSVPVGELQVAAANRGAAFPDVRGPLDWNQVIEARQIRVLNQKKAFELGAGPRSDQTDAVTRFRARSEPDPRRFAELWAEQGEAPTHRGDQIRLAEAYAGMGREAQARALARRISLDSPTDALLIDAILALRAEDIPGAATAIEAAVASAHEDPWFTGRLFISVLEAARKLPSGPDADALRRAIFEGLARPLVVGRLGEWRLRERLALAHAIDFQGTCVEVYAEQEPWVRFERGVLRERLECYKRNGHPLAGQALADFERYERLAGPVTFGHDLPPSQ